MSVHHRLGYQSDLQAQNGPASAHGLRAAWLAKVRWGAFAAQVFAIAAAALYLDFDIPAVPLLSLAALTAGSNVALVRRVRRGTPVSDRLAGAILSLDVLVLTGLLYLAGGPSNPFSVFFLVEITIAAVILGSRWTWFLAALSVVCYGVLFLLPHAAVDMSMPQHDHGEWTFSFHLEGMGLALCAGAALTAYFVTRLSRAIEARDAEIAVMREAAARQERLSALTTLAAGAAHELNTPMSTIALTARELELALSRAGSADANSLVDDARLIRAEVDRCRHIVQGMSPGFGADVGETSVRLTAERILSDVMEQLSAGDAARVQVAFDDAAVATLAPRRALTSTIANLIRNAIDASDGAAPVAVATSVHGDCLRVTVRDTGGGMPADVLAHAGEPFFTTKPPGRGMGLGLFLARSLADRLGGRFVLDSKPGAGTCATIEIPLQDRPADEHLGTA